MSKREDILEMFREALPGKPVIWTSERTTLGDFDGRELTLEIFNVSWRQERELLRTLRPQRQRARELLGQSVQLLFHSPEDTVKHHAWVLQEPAELEPPPTPKGPAAALENETAARTAAARPDAPMLAGASGPPRGADREAA